MEKRVKKTCLRSGKKGVMWQPQVEKKWLAALLANKKAVVLLLKFLKTTEVGRRKRAKKREIEWKQRSDWIDENLFE